MPTVTEINKKYKEEKKLKAKLAKLEKDKAKKLSQKQLSLERQMKLEREKKRSAINMSYEKKLAKFKKLQQRQLEKKKREIEGKKPLKKHQKKEKTTAKLKQELYTLIQKYVRLLRSDVAGMGYCISCGAYRHYKELQGGHLLGRSNMVTAFDIDNIRPQCPRCNMAMAGKFGLDEAKKIEGQYIANLSEKIGKTKVDWILAQKFKPRKRNRGVIIEMIAEYKKLNKELESKKQHPLL